MKRPTPFYQKLYWTQFFSETITMNGMEKGAYLLLMGHYFVTRYPLPDDDGRLALMTGLPLEQWQAIRPAVERHFEVRRGWWRHYHIEQELEEAARIREAKRQGGWSAREKVRARRKAQEAG